MAAGLKTLDMICAPGFYEALTMKTTKFLQGMQHAADEAGIAFTSNQVGGMFGLFFNGDKTISRFAQVMACDVDRFKRFFHAMLDHGVYLAPSAFEAGFVSAAHSENDIAETLDAASAVFKTL
jgi:glutamate-1-semialdehyde 2,1-aminomutase